jgi:hypothetical protein
MLRRSTKNRTIGETRPYFRLESALSGHLDTFVKSQLVLLIVTAVAAMIGTGASDFRNSRGSRASFSGTPLT